MPAKKTVLSSLLWKFLERSGSQGVQFVVSIVLARLLDPDDFGLIALVTIIILIANVFIQNSFSTALIQKKDADALDFSSVFYTTLFVSIILYGICFVGAPYIALFYERTELVPVIRVLTLVLIIGSVNSVQEAYVARNMLFKKLFVRSIGAAIPSGVVGILCAYRGMGVWSLVIQQLLNVSFMGILMWFTVKWRPQLIFSIDRVKKLFSFGWKILVSGLIDVGFHNLRSLVIGKMFTAETLGFYSRGSQFPGFIIHNVNASIQSVMLPSLSSVQDDRVKMKQMMRRSIEVSSFVIVPILAGVAALAKPLVIFLLGEKWLPSVPFIQIYCFTYSFWPIHTSNLSAINAIGRSDIFLKLEIIKKVLGISVLIFFIYMFHNPIGIASTGLVLGVVSSFLNAYPNSKLLNYGYLEQIRDVIPSYVLSGIMFVGLLSLTKIPLSPVVQLVLFSFAGCIFYLGIAKLFRFDCLEYVVRTLKELKKKK